MMEARKLRAEAGSLSMFMAILLPALVLVQLILVASAKSALYQAQIEIKLEQETERALSYYDVRLYDDYGLWGMSSGLDARLNGDRVVQNSLAEVPGLQLEGFTMLGELEKPEGLKPQLVNFMKPRYPVLLLEALRSLSTQMQGLTQHSALQPFTEAVQHNATDMQQVSELLGAGEAKGRLPADKKVEVELFSFLQDKLEQVLAVPMDFKPEEPVESCTQNLNRAFAIAEGVYNYDLGAAYDSLLIREYALRMFPADMHSRALPDNYPFSADLKNRKLAESQLKGAKLEYICTGLEGEQAVAAVKGYVFAMRYLCRLVEILSDTARQAQYRNWSTIIAAAVSIVSLGELNVQPDIIYQLLVLIGAAVEAKDDLAALSSGMSVNFTVGNGSTKIPTFFHDYVRLILLLQTDEQLLGRVGNCIKEDLGVEHYVALNLEAAWDNPLWPAETEHFSLDRKYYMYYPQE